MITGLSACHGHTRSIIIIIIGANVCTVTEDSNETNKLCVSGQVNLLHLLYLVCFCFFFVCGLFKI